MCIRVNISTATSSTVATICATRRTRMRSRYTARAVGAASGRQIGAGEQIVAQRDLDEILDLFRQRYRVGNLVAEDDRRGGAVALLDIIVLRGTFGRIQLLLTVQEQLVDHRIVPAGVAVLDGGI